MNTSEQSNPGVRFPPPITFAAGLALGFLLQHFFSITILETSRNHILKLLGGVVVISAGLLAVSAIVTFRFAHTTVRPDRPTSALVTHGPFRLTRNPMYVSLSLAYAGIAILANALWPLLFLPPVLLIIRYYVIAREESYLLSHYGPEYHAYMNSVRRWL